MAGEVCCGRAVAAGRDCILWSWAGHLLLALRETSGVLIRRVHRGWAIVWTSLEELWIAVEETEVLAVLGKELLMVDL